MGLGCRPLGNCVLIEAASLGPGAVGAQASVCFSLIHASLGGWAMNAVEKLPPLTEPAFCLKGGPASVQLHGLR